MTDTGDADFLDKLFAEYDALLAKRNLRKERPWTFDIIRVLWGMRNPSGMRIDDLVRELWRIREPSGLNMPKAFGKTVQSTLNQHTSQSSEWQKHGAKAENDLFYSPRGKRSGTWAVHRERALEWVSATTGPALRGDAAITWLEKQLTTLRRPTIRRIPRQPLGMLSTATTLGLLFGAHARPSSAS